MLIASILLLSAQTHAVVFDEHPVEGQLYPRDTQSLASVKITGRVQEPGWQTLTVYTERDGNPFAVEVQQLVYSGGHANFNVSVSIRAERHSYSFRLLLGNSVQSKLIETVRDVVAGDVFLLEGQSNTVAWDAYGEGLANREQSRWVRSFGSASADPMESFSDQNWYMADGEAALDKGTVGQWGLRMGRLLVDQTNIPVAIINGAVGATAIRYHLRHDHDPDDVRTMYGRLLTRARHAGVADSVRAILWHQGESDGSRAENYAEKFPQLYHDWLEDYPSVEQIYMFQVREGCAQPSIELREVQRRLKDFLPLLQVMSTTAVPSHDSCHFHYAGYAEFANRITRLVARDLYGSGITQNIDAPDIDSVTFANAAHDELLLTFRDLDDTLHFDPGVVSDFVLEDGVTVQSGTVSGNTILLSLSGATNSRTLSYIGHQLDGAWITNARGIGALTFMVLIRP